MKPFFYDLTELLYLSGGFKSYYGVAKVVAEGAREAHHAQIGVRFVAFSQAHGDFFEVFPSADAKANAQNGRINVPRIEDESVGVRRINFIRPALGTLSATPPSA
ncbi:MAG: hypothetical protein AAFR45_01770, partial [Pseudomonadota bacterium]